MNEYKSSLHERPTADYLICSCFGVTYFAIINEIEAGAHDFRELQKRLNVGKGCGSCVPEVLEILSQKGF